MCQDQFYSEYLRRKTFCINENNIGNFVISHNRREICHPPISRINASLCGADFSYPKGFAAFFLAISTSLVEVGG